MDDQRVQPRVRLPDAHRRRLGDRFGRRKLYVIGLGLFTASSVACATAGSAGALIAARAAEGAGAAVVLPVSLALISEAFPPEKRGTAIGIWGGITGLGVATAPLLGGAIIQGIGSAACC